MTVNTRFIPKLFIKNNNSKLKAKSLKQKGLHIYAKLVQFQQCNSKNNGYKNYHKDSILGIDPEYQLIAEWFDPDSNKKIELKSRHIKTNEDTLKYFFNTYRNVSIYIDPKNKDNYYFDLPVFVK